VEVRVLSPVFKQASKSSLDAKSNELFLFADIIWIMVCRRRRNYFVYVLTHTTNKYIVDM
ncbi:hypothetical protein, partial [Paenibacillus taichungensis]|uniref:hypothetical protein n=1 Tax=Paenibacillus taichungensis TaxID=484184 RepID=UPI001C52EB64